MIQISNVSFKYKNGEGLDHINLSIEPGEFVYLIGPSGAGKSTVLKLIYMDILPNTGHTFDVKHPFSDNTLPESAQKVIAKTIDFLKQ